MNETSSLLVVALLVFLIMEDQQQPSAFNYYGAAANAPPIPAPPKSAPAAHDPDDLGVFKPVLSLPLVGQAYQVLKPIEDNVLRPIFSKTAPGSFDIKENPDGTVTVHHKDSVQKKAVVAVTKWGASKVVSAAAGAESVVSSAYHAVTSWL